MPAAYKRSEQKFPELVKLLLSPKLAGGKQAGFMLDAGLRISFFITKYHTPMAVQVGNKAPGFTLVSSDNQQVSLSDYAGKNIVLLFFPMAFTSVCTAELCDMRDNLSFYEGLNAQILAVSVDSPFTLGKFRSEQNLNFPLLSDFNKEVSPSYGAWYEEFVLGLKGVAKRAAFVIDREGVVRYAEVLESAGDLPNFQALKETLSQIN